MKVPIGNLKRSIVIFIALLVGVAAVLMKPAGPTLAAMKSPSPALLAPVAFAAAGPCGDKSKRYFDCGNGTVTDSLTGLIWLKNATCLPSSNWADAKKAAATLKNGDCMLTDGSSAGEWRLPTNKEWEATMAKAKGMNCSYPTLTNDAGTECIKAGPSSFTDVESDYYWTSVPVEGGDRVYFGDLDHGNILNGDSSLSQRVWPVRGGQR